MRANLINNGILPLVLENEADYDALSQGDALTVDNAREQVRAPCRARRSW